MQHKWAIRVLLGRLVVPWPLESLSASPIRQCLSLYGDHCRRVALRTYGRYRSLTKVSSSKGCVDAANEYSSHVHSTYAATTYVPAGPSRQKCLTDAPRPSLERRAVPPVVSAASGPSPGRHDMGKTEPGDFIWCSSTAASIPLMTHCFVFLVDGARNHSRMRQLSASCRSRGRNRGQILDAATHPSRREHLSPSGAQSISPSWLRINE